MIYPLSFFMCIRPSPRQADPAERGFDVGTHPDVAMETD
jgi:hypothetical protein